MENHNQLSPNAFKTPLKTFQDSKLIKKQQKRKDIFPTDQLNLEKKSRQINISKTYSQDMSVTPAFMMNESFVSDDTQSQSILANNTQIQMPIPHIQRIPLSQPMMGF